MGKNVAVFVDVANIFYAAKAAGVDIDYVLLLKAATAGRDLVRAYAYTGLDPDNENQRNFHSFLARNGFKVVSKDIRKYGDGKVKANLDIELVVDLMKTSRNLDVAVVVSGDGDFAPAIRAVQETGVRVEVISFRGNTSSDLMEVADKFTDITQLAKVEKGSTVSGRRVATDEMDLSMTEVPDKESEGTGRARGRGRGRVRPERVEEAGVESVAPSRGRGRGRRTTAEPVAAPVGAPVGAPLAVAVAAAGALVALPGEKLSKAAAARLAVDATDVGPADVGSADEAAEEAMDSAALDGELGAEGDERQRRRRRRGGRGRGRGRGTEPAVGAEGVPVPEDVDAPAAADEEEEEALEEPARPARRPAAFGSVWDSQIGVPSSPRAATPVDDEEYDDEPAIPEYLIAERRGGAQRGPQRGSPRGPQRGRGGAYAAAVDRERYGGRGVSRLSEPAGRGSPGSQRGGPRPPRAPQPTQARDRGHEHRSSSEPWSEVPPELEELLRAQLAHKLARLEPEPAVSPPGDEAPATPRRRARKPATIATGVPAAEAYPPAGADGETEGSPPPRRRTRRATPAASVVGAGEASPVAGATPATSDSPPAAERATPSRRTRQPAPAAAVPPEAVAAPARKPRTRKGVATPTEAETPAPPATARKPRARKAAPAEGA